VQETPVPYDPALTAIAVATNDALPDHVWRHDITTADTNDPIAQIAAELHHTALTFTATAQTLTRFLDHIGDTYRHAATAITDLADFDIKATHGSQFVLDQQTGRFDTERRHLLDLYAMWRRHRPTSPDPRRHHLWLQPHDPRWGMVTLHADTGGTTWLVTPDTTATDAFATPSPGTLIGDIWNGSNGWQTTAYRDLQHHSEPDSVFRLPPTASQAAACRTLMRWWALRATDHGTTLTPEHLTGEQLRTLTD
jgi:hypothetical protein